MTAEERFLRRLRRAQARQRRKQERLARLAEIERLKQERRVLQYKKQRARLRMKVLRNRIKLIKLQLTWLNGGPYSRITAAQSNSISSTYLNPDGSVSSAYTESYPSMITADHDRQGHSANPIRALPNYPGTLWRNPSNYSRFQQEVTYSPAKFEWRDSNGLVRLIEEGDCIDPSIVNYGPHLFYGPDIITNENLFARANTECLLKLQDQKVNLGENLATIKDTIRLVSSTASNVFRAVLAAKHGRWGTVAKLLGVEARSLGSGKALANRWLEYQFAWHPMFQDIYAGIDLIKNASDRAFIFSAVRRVKEKETDIKPSSGWVTGVTGYSDISCQCKVYAAVDNDNLHLLNQIGLLNPLEVAWELVPYSFVIDWFLPVGNFLQALSAVAGLNFIGGSITWRVESEITQTWRRPHPFSGLTCTDEGTVKTKSFALNRQMMTGWPVALPYTKNPFTTTHLLDAAALIRGAFR